MKIKIIKRGSSQQANVFVPVAYRMKRRLQQRAAKRVAHVGVRGLSPGGWHTVLEKDRGL